LCQTIQHCLSDKEKNPQQIQNLASRHHLDIHQILTFYSSKQILATQVT